MGLKCSVLGHKYGDATVERDREEQGSEVVITIREIETCNRCGDERTVSENKEVTTLATPDEPADESEDGAGDGASGDESTDGPGEPGSTEDEAPVDATGEDADVVSDAPDEATGEFGDDAGNADDAVTNAPPVDATEGAEILEAEAEPEDAVTDDELADPSIEGPPLGDDPVEDDPVEEDAVIIDDEDEADEEQGREPGAWPEEPDDDTDDDWTPSDALDEETPITAPDAGTENNAAVTIPDGQFRCPECGYTTLVEDSSLRAGDFCPDCRKGSLVHEPRDETRKE